MCGIAGVINYEKYNLLALQNALLHRGPDEQSILRENNVALVQTRLAIQDISHGSQPFHFEDYVITLNGEIYNHLSLRNLLPEFSFRTRSDTETLLYLYIKYKERCFQHLDGMFAFCIYNKKEHTLFLARDRAGKKPLYYIQTQDSFIFASELNAIASITDLSINPDAIQCYLRAGFIFKPYTAYQGVYELPAGHNMTINTHSLQHHIKAYFNILDRYLEPAFSLPPSDALALVEKNLRKSVESRLLASDIEVGAFLSGGIDSNLIVAMASQVNPDLKTFTVKFAKTYDESQLARLTASRYGTNHHEIQINMSVEQDIERILLAYGEPFMDSSAIPSYYVSKEARQHVKVILNGDGADELFGGYRRYVPFATNTYQVAKWFSPLRKLLPKPHNKQSKYNYLYRLLAMGNKTGLDFYLSASSDIFEDAYRFGHSKILDEMHAYIIETLSTPKLTSLSKLLYLDFNLILFSDLLVKMDIATMAHSLEGRSPFLSKYMLELAPTLSDNMKIKGFKTKYILRELAKKYLPSALIHQPKRGFEVPLKLWVNTLLREKISTALQPGCYAENYVNPRFIHQLLQKPHQFPEEKRAKMLWTLYCLEVWHSGLL